MFYLTFIDTNVRSQCVYYNIYHFLNIITLILILTTTFMKKLLAFTLVFVSLVIATQAQTPAEEKLKKAKEAKADVKKEAKEVKTDAKEAKDKADKKVKEAKEDIKKETKEAKDNVDKKAKEVKSDTKKAADKLSKKDEAEASLATRTKVAGADKSIGKDAKGRTIYVGTKGGQYYINSSGNKTYLSEDSKLKI